MELQKALSIANGIVESLSPHSEIINVAGSCRRGKPEVKDLELVVIPKRKILKDVFGDEFLGDRTKEFIDALQLLGTGIKGSPVDGRYVQIKLPEGLKLDLFMPVKEDYYRQFAIRTGSSDYSRHVLAAGWLKIGWCGSDAGLRKIKDCVKTKTGWKCVNKDAELPPAWQSEQEFFDWLKVRWMEPPLRNI